MLQPCVLPSICQSCGCCHHSVPVSSSSMPSITIYISFLCTSVLSVSSNKYHPFVMFLIIAFYIYFLFQSHWLVVDSPLHVWMVTLSANHKAQLLWPGGEGFWCNAALPWTGRGAACSVEERWWWWWCSVTWPLH